MPILETEEPIEATIKMRFQVSATRYSGFEGHGFEWEADAVELTELEVEGVPVSVTKLSPELLAVLKRFASEGTFSE